MENGSKSITELLKQKFGGIRGAGDLVAGIAGVFVTQPCSSCEERRKKLNAVFPFERGKTGSYQQIER